MARTVTFSDEIQEIQPSFSGRIAMVEALEVSKLANDLSKIVTINHIGESRDNGDNVTIDDSTSDNQSPQLSEKTSVRFEYHEQYSNGCKINFGRSFGTKGSGYGELQDATDVVALKNSSVLVSDMVNSKLQIFNDTGSPTIAYVLDELIEPRGIAVTPDGNIAATSRKIQAVTLLSTDGRLLGTFGKNIFQGPSGIAVDNQGNFIVTDMITNKVSLVDKNGNFIQHIGKTERFKQPRYVTVSKQGDIIVSDSGNNCLKVFDSRGRFLRQIGKFGKQDGFMKVPYATCTDAFGNILVADHYNDRISVYSSKGKFLRNIVTSAHGLSHPQGLSLSPEMVLYVSHGGLKANQVAAFELNFDGIQVDIVADV